MNTEPITYNVSFIPKESVSRTKASFHNLATARKFANAVNGQLLAPKEANRSYFAGKLWNALNPQSPVRN